MMQRAIKRIERNSYNSNDFLYSGIAQIMRRTERFFWHLSNKRVVECFGDSHIVNFRELNNKPCLHNWRFRSVSVQGATALGMVNPNSQTNALNIFKKWIMRCNKNDYLLFCLGEVDTGFLIWLLSKKRGVTPDLILKESLSRYQEFLLLVQKERPNVMNVIVMSAPLPTIRDGTEKGKTGNARSEITIPQAQRTEMALRFNREMASWCSQSGIVFLNLDPLSIDDSTKLVKKELLNIDEKDHHYNTESFIELISKVFVSYCPLGSNRKVE